MCWLAHKLDRFKPWLDDPATIEVSVNPDHSI